MSPYDAFAAHYDDVVGPRDAVARYLRELIVRYHPSAKTLLELGCGSGTMLSSLCRHYACNGIDLSKSMLKIARKKASQATLHHGDIASFSLGRTFDVLLCPFDTMNHITSIAKWRSTFKCAHQHLNPGGIFIFDVNTEHKLECYREEPLVTENTDQRTSIIEVRRHRRYRYEIILKRFEQAPNKMFRLHSMILPEIVVPTETILKALGTFFKRVTIIDPDRPRPTSESDELFFVCMQPR